MQLNVDHGCGTCKNKGVKNVKRRLQNDVSCCGRSPENTTRNTRIGWMFPTWNQQPILPTPLHMERWQTHMDRPSLEDSSPVIHIIIIFEEQCDVTCTVLQKVAVWRDVCSGMIACACGMNERLVECECDCFWLQFDWQKGHKQQAANNAQTNITQTSVGSVQIQTGCDCEGW